VDDQELFDYTALLGALGNGKPWAAAGSARAKPSAKASTGSKPSKLKATAPGVRYFELIGGGSRKFWEVRVHGKSFTTRYGKIGQPGQNTRRPSAPQRRPRPRLTSSRSRRRGKATENPSSWIARERPRRLLEARRSHWRP